jgi:hypothetical protein
VAASRDLARRVAAQHGPTDEPTLEAPPSASVDEARPPPLPMSAAADEAPRELVSPPSWDSDVRGALPSDPEPSVTRSEPTADATGADLIARLAARPVPRAEPSQPTPTPRPRTEASHEARVARDVSPLPDAWTRGRDDVRIPSVHDEDTGGEGVAEALSALRSGRGERASLRAPPHGPPEPLAPRGGSQGSRLRLVLGVGVGVALVAVVIMVSYSALQGEPKLAPSSTPVPIGAPVASDSASEGAAPASASEPADASSGGAARGEVSEPRRRRKAASSASASSTASASASAVVPRPLASEDPYGSELTGAGSSAPPR